jgi:hypothetical protein
MKEVFFIPKMLVKQKKPWTDCFNDIEINKLVEGIW